MLAQESEKTKTLSNPLASTPQLLLFLFYYLWGVANEFGQCVSRKA